MEWDIIHTDLVNMIQSFINDGYLKQLNQTFITLIPKREAAIYQS